MNDGESSPPRRQLEVHFFKNNSLTLLALSPTFKWPSFSANLRSTSDI